MNERGAIKNPITFEAHSNSLTFSSNGRYLGSAGYEAAVRLWSTDDWREERTLPLKGKGVFPLAFSPDNKRLAVGTEYLVQLWSVENGELLEEILVKPKGVCTVAFHRTGAGWR